MSSQSSYVHGGLLQRNVRQPAQHVNREVPLSDRHASIYYPPQASTSSPDAGQYLGVREMGPPSSFHSAYSSSPRPIGIELHSSRTLPNPATSSASLNDFASPAFGHFADFAQPSVGRPVDNPNRAPDADPLQQWYTGNDGPWIPKGISVVSDERSHSRLQPGPRMPTTYTYQHRRQNPSDAGTYPYGVADSGYGTRHSDENASVFSSEINDRDHDCHSLAGHMTSFQPFQELNTEQNRDPRIHEAWVPISGSSSTDTSLVCQSCQRTVKTRSELKKHELRHTKPFVCTHPGCTRAEGFSTTNDLYRHTKSKHPLDLIQSASTKRFRCHVQGCKSKDKSWPRLDNFRSHLKRVHSQILKTDEEFDMMIKRAEYLEHTGQTKTQETLTPQRPSASGTSQAVAPHPQDSLPKASVEQPGWTQKPFTHPEVIEPIHGSLPTKRPLAGTHIEKPIQGSHVPVIDVQIQETVEPVQVFQQPLSQVQISPPSLGNILPPLVGVRGIKNTSCDKVAVTPPPVAARPNKISPQGKTLRTKEVSTFDATDAIIAALAGAESPQETKSGSLDSDQNLHPESLPDGQLPESSRSKKSPAENSNAHTTSSSPAVQKDSKSLQEKKAREVLKTLQNLGYIVQKDPSHSPKPQNPGSAASNKSDNVVVCEVCKGFRGRPCELKKHMKRHSRPYGCTFLTCNKTFGSKNDWKRHENSQHFHLETWRCNVEKHEGLVCTKVCYRRQSFQDHLKKDHGISDADAVKDKVESCRIGRNCQARFWCGFCTKLVELTKKGVDAWTERFDHIDDHFSGKNSFEQKGIQDWIPVDSDKPRDLDTQSAPDTESPEDSASGNSSNEEFSGGSGDAAVTSANLPNVDNNPQSGSKRPRSSNDDAGKAAKHQKTATRRDTIVICCQCDAAGNPRLESNCTVCPDSHEFCENCTHKARPAGQDKEPES